jgi:ABC-type lipoprotein release transport system permease subunit
MKPIWQQQECVLLLFALSPFLFLLVAGFGIYNILNMTVMQKINDIAILKAIGFNGKDVVRIFVSQALIIGLIGIVFGVLFASIMVAVYKVIMLVAILVFSQFILN